MNQSINTDSKNSKEPQQKYRLGTVSIKILGGLNRFYRRLTSPSASIMAQNIQLFGPRGGFQDWATNNSFKFSNTKTVCMHFCQLRKAYDDPVLTLDGISIPVVEETKFLGVIFYKTKLTFIPHIKKLKAKCPKALNLLRVVAHTDWGADRKVLLHLYRTIVRSKLDFGSIVYDSARESYL